MRSNERVYFHLCLEITHSVFTLLPQQCLTDTTWPHFPSSTLAARFIRRRARDYSFVIPLSEHRTSFSNIHRCHLLFTHPLHDVQAAARDGLPTNFPSKVSKHWKRKVNKSSASFIKNWRARGTPIDIPSQPSFLLIPSTRLIPTHRVITKKERSAVDKESRAPWCTHALIIDEWRLLETLSFGNPKPDPRTSNRSNSPINIKFYCAI